MLTVLLAYCRENNYTLRPGTELMAADEASITSLEWAIHLYAE